MRHTITFIASACLQFTKSPQRNKMMIVRQMLSLLDRLSCSFDSYVLTPRKYRTLIHKTLSKGAKPCRPLIYF